MAILQRCVRELSIAPMPVEPLTAWPGATSRDSGIWSFGGGLCLPLLEPHAAPSGIAAPPAPGSVRPVARQASGPDGAGAATAQALKRVWPFLSAATVGNRGALLGVTLCATGEGSAGALCLPCPGPGH